ncbi:MAG: TIGR03792 family protein [Cyanobacteria bacterium]|nr:TIGR03792 family protein [Cyanobacteria bacterium bin.51]
MSRALVIGLTALFLVGLLGLGWARPFLRTARASSLPPEGGASDVVEVLRLKVPAEQRGCWLQAEALSWDPWLRQQTGYQGRQLLWDPKRQEGVLLISWARRADWQAITAESVAVVQSRFEADARRCLGLQQGSSEEGSGNPFPLISSDELLPELAGDPLPPQR